MSTHFIEPLDVLILRDNKLFGDPGSYGQSSLPPWPSVAAGALRSWLLVHDDVDLARFANNEIIHPTLGTPAKPGSFILTNLQLARRRGESVECFRQPPADLMVMEEGNDITTRQLEPIALADGILSSTPLPKLPTLAQNARSKPASGYWLNEAGWAGYLEGKPVPSDGLVRANTLFQTELRVGIGLESNKRSVREGALFSTQVIAMRSDKHGATGFMATVSGAELPAEGMLRFGGDGRGARISQATLPTAHDLVDQILTTRCCRIILTSPGVFANGWRLPGMDEEGRFSLNGVRGRVVSACVQRGDVISGFDLAKRQPKPAERMAPAGSVYWLDDLESDPETLRKLADHGLWPSEDYDAARRAEGFNRFVFGLWRAPS